MLLFMDVRLAGLGRFWLSVGIAGPNLHVAALAGFLVLLLKMCTKCQGLQAPAGVRIAHIALALCQSIDVSDHGPSMKIE